ncbi:MAG: CDP-alcohol phosphatidyltransferase family protein [Thermomicrobium sp.]
MQTWLAEFRRSLKLRPAPEVVNCALFRPLGFLVARSCLRTPVRPTDLALAHAVLGLCAARFMARGADRLAALLLQVVTVLDNADGQLARLRGEETELGRYLDTELDAAVNFALFVAVAARTGQWYRSLAAFTILTLLLSWDFNVEYFYRSVRGEVFRHEVRDRDSWGLALARWIYRIVYTPQDQAIRWLERKLLALAARGDPNRAEVAQRWWGRWVTFAGANLGLSTQYAWLGIFLWRQRLSQYPTFVLSQLLVPLVVTLGRWVSLSTGIRRPASTESFPSRA